MQEDNDIISLEAKVTGLTMLIEALYVNAFSTQQQPEVLGEEIMRSALQAEKAAIHEAGVNGFALQITETISGVIDRAVLRAKTLKQKEPPF